MNNVLSVIWCIKTFITKKMTSNKCTLVIMLKATSVSVFHNLVYYSGNFTYGRFTIQHTTRTICRLDIKIDIKYLAILYPQYTDEAMTLVHINGPSLTQKKKDGQFLLHWQYKRWRHSRRLTLANINKSGQTLSVTFSCM